HEVAGGEHADVGHGHPGVLQRGHGGLGGQVDDGVVRALAELGHVDPEDPDVSAGHQAAPCRGSNAKFTASVPAVSSPTGTVVSFTFIPSWTCSGSSSTLTTLPRTDVPSQS